MKKLWRKFVEIFDEVTIDPPALNPCISDTMPEIDWTADDAGNLHAFLTSATGMKLRKRMFFSVVEQSIPRSEESVTDPKVVLGMNAMREEVLSLADVERFVIDEDNA